MAADYWLVKRTEFDIPALYDPLGRYRYISGFNWRAAVAFLVPVTPLLPGLAQSISGQDAVPISAGEQNLYTFNWLFGFVTAIVLYTSLSLIFPAKESLVKETIWDLEEIEGVREGSDVEKGGLGKEEGGSGKDEGPIEI